MEKMSFSRNHGKRRQITFRIGPIAQDRLEHIAAIFNMKPSEYAKAVLYRDLGVFNESLDQRKRSWRQKKKLQQEEEFDFDSETEEDSELEPMHGRHSTSRTS
jgi:dTDP-4-amino-4,6-dideoxygalactose transaminase